MDPAILFVLFAIVAVAFGIWSWMREQQRREAWFLAANQLGFEYSREDPFSIVRMPFSLFRKGDGRGAENVAWGRWKDLDVRVFDYWYYTESTDSKGNTSRSYSRFTCAMTPVPDAWPHLSVTRETVLSRLGDFVGFRDIQFESDEFNRCFQVKSSDPRFASYLIDPRMMQWLLDGNTRWSFEMNAGWLLVWSGRLREPKLHGHLYALAGFLRQVPKVVHEVFGSR
ncbi:MAG TPA: DUF3137 domain-containing protein [Actinomycetota bacterium]|nr:DUF3137 domain-containing protein [Actinomycetota bacterium]